MIPQLSEYLKYGLIGFGAIVVVLAYYLLRAEQNKSPRKPSIINGLYAFMVLGVILVLFGLFTPNTNSRQKSNIVVEGSNKNTVNSMQRQGDSTVDQSSDIRMNQSDSNKVQSIQVGGKDTVKVD